jgi:hypothetical protein
MRSRNWLEIKSNSLLKVANWQCFGNQLWIGRVCLLRLAGETSSQAFSKLPQASGVANNHKAAFPASYPMDADHGLQHSWKSGLTIELSGAATPIGFHDNLLETA